MTSKAIDLLYIDGLLTYKAVPMILPLFQADETIFSGQIMGGNCTYPRQYSDNMMKITQIQKVLDQILRACRVHNYRPFLIPETSTELDLATLPRLLGRPDPIILDIGSNDGSHTLGFLRLFPRAKVYAFEPDPRAQKRWRLQVQDQRATLFPIALSSVDGSINFYVSNGLPSPEWEKSLPEGWDYSGSIHQPLKHLEDHPWCTFNETIQVETLRLDTWRSQHQIDRIDFIWADVQGAEGDLIEGGKETFLRTRFFYTEYSNNELYQGQVNIDQICRMLPGYRIVKRFPGDVLLKNTSLEK